MALKNKERISKILSSASKDKKNIALIGHGNALAKQFGLIQLEEKKLKTKKDALKKELSKMLKEHPLAYKDDKGSVFLAVGDGISLKSERRLSVSLDQEKAVEFAESKGLVKELTHTEVIADMSSFEQLYLNGDIEESDMTELALQKESFAFKIVIKK